MLLEALQLRLRYAGEAVQAGELERAEAIVSGVHEGCELAMRRLRALGAEAGAAASGR
jgi:hypothetical protein